MTTSRIEQKEPEPNGTFLRGNLVIDNSGIIVIVNSAIDSMYFSGSALCGTTLEIGQHQIGWIKYDFVQFHGKVILEA